MKNNSKTKLKVIVKNPITEEKAKEKIEELKKVLQIVLTN